MKKEKVMKKLILLGALWCLGGSQAYAGEGEVVRPKLDPKVFEYKTQYDPRMFEKEGEKLFEQYRVERERAIAEMEKTRNEIIKRYGEEDPEAKKLDDLIKESESDLDEIKTLRKVATEGIFDPTTGKTEFFTDEQKKQQIEEYSERDKAITDHAQEAQDVTQKFIDKIEREIGIPDEKPIRKPIIEPSEYYEDTPYNESMLYGGEENAGLWFDYEDVRRKAMEEWTDTLAKMPLNYPRYEALRDSVRRAGYALDFIDSVRYRLQEKPYKTEAIKERKINSTLDAHRELDYVTGRARQIKEEFEQRPVPVQPGSPKPVIEPHMFTFDYDTAIILDPAKEADWNQFRKPRQEEIQKWQDAARSLEQLGIRDDRTMNLNQAAKSAQVALDFIDEVRTDVQENAFESEQKKKESIDRAPDANRTIEETTQNIRPLADQVKRMTASPEGREVIEYVDEKGLQQPKKWYEKGFLGKITKKLSDFFFPKPDTPLQREQADFNKATNDYKNAQKTANQARDEARQRTLDELKDDETRTEAQKKQLAEKAAQEAYKKAMSDAEQTFLKKARELGDAQSRVLENSSSDLLTALNQYDLLLREYPTESDKLALLNSRVRDFYSDLQEKEDLMRRAVNDEFITRAGFENPYETLGINREEIKIWPEHGVTTPMRFKDLDPQVQSKIIEAAYGARMDGIVPEVAAQTKKQSLENLRSKGLITDTDAEIAEQVEEARKEAQANFAQNRAPFDASLADLTQNKAEVDQILDDITEKINFILDVTNLREQFKDLQDQYLASYLTLTTRVDNTMRNLNDALRKARAAGQ